MQIKNIKIQNIKTKPLDSYYNSCVGGIQR